MADAGTVARRGRPLVAVEAGPQPARAAGVGHVRLGQLGLHDDGAADLPHLLRRRGRRRAFRPRRPPPLRPGHHVSMGSWRCCRRSWARWPTTRRAKKKMLAGFLGLGVVATGGMALHRQGRLDARRRRSSCWRNIGVTSSLVFYESLLPHIAARSEVDRVSSAGYAMGYVGGGLLMALQRRSRSSKPGLLGHRRTRGRPSARRSSSRRGLVGALLDPALPPRAGAAAPRRGRTSGRAGASLRVAVSRLGETLREMRCYRHDVPVPGRLLHLQRRHRHHHPHGRRSTGARSASSTSSLIAALLIVQLVGIPFSFLFGMHGRRGSAPSAPSSSSLAVYLVISVLGYSMKTAREFFVLAALVGTVQGGSQALSPLALHRPWCPSTSRREFFAFFSVFEKFAGILGPLVFAAMIARHRLQPQRHPLARRLLPGRAARCWPWWTSRGPARGARGGGPARCAA